MIAYDWTVLDEPGVAGIASRAAEYIAGQYKTAAIDADDLFQEASLILASKASRVRMHLANEAEGLIAKELQRDLIDKIRPESERGKRNYSRDRLIEEYAS